MLTNSQHRSPEVVDVLLVPGQDGGIGHCGIDQGEEPRILRFSVTTGYGDLAHDLVVQARRGAKTIRSIVGPVKADHRLVIRSLRDAPRQRSHEFGRNSSTPHFPQRFEVLGVVERWLDKLMAAR